MRLHSVDVCKESSHCSSFDLIGNKIVWPRCLSCRVEMSLLKAMSFFSSRLSDPENRGRSCQGHGFLRRPKCRGQLGVFAQSARTTSHSQGAEGGLSQQCPPHAFPIYGKDQPLLPRERKGDAQAFATRLPRLWNTEHHALKLSRIGGQSISCHPSRRGAKPTSS